LEPRTYFVVDMDSTLVNKAPWAITATHFKIEGDLAVFYQNGEQVAALRLSYGQTVSEQNAIVSIAAQ
jgi:hypothetical protein